jgi:hypothetical protein
VLGLRESVSCGRHGQLIIVVSLWFRTGAFCRKPLSRTNPISSATKETVILPRTKPLSLTINLTPLAHVDVVLLSKKPCSSSTSDSLFFCPNKAHVLNQALYPQHNKPKAPPESSTVHAYINPPSPPTFLIPFPPQVTNDYHSNTSNQPIQPTTNNPNTMSSPCEYYTRRFVLPLKKELAQFEAKMEAEDIPQEEVLKQMQVFRDRTHFSLVFKPWRCDASRRGKDCCDCTLLPVLDAYVRCAIRGIKTGGAESAFTRPSRRSD